MRFVLFAQIAATAPAALAQEIYTPPRTTEGHPDFSGTWGTLFKRLVLTDKEARKGMAAFTKGVPDLVDPDFYIQNIQQAARVRREYRSSLLILPARRADAVHRQGAEAGRACRMDGRRRA